MKTSMRSFLSIASVRSWTARNPARKETPAAPAPASTGTRSELSSLTRRDDKQGTAPRRPEVRLSTSAATVPAQARQQPTKASSTAPTAAPHTGVFRHQAATQSSLRLSDPNNIRKHRRTPSIYIPAPKPAQRSSSPDDLWWDKALDEAQAHYGELATRVPLAEHDRARLSLMDPKEIRSLLQKGMSLQHIARTAPGPDSPTLPPEPHAPLEEPDDISISDFPAPPPRASSDIAIEVMRATLGAGQAFTKEHQRASQVANPTIPPIREEESE